MLALRPASPKKASRIIVVVWVSFSFFLNTPSKTRHWLKMACVVLLGWKPTDLSSSRTFLSFVSSSCFILGRRPAATSTRFSRT